MSSLDADKYRLATNDIRGYMRTKTDKERLEFIGMAAVATNVPIIVVGCYVGELYGFSPELIKMIQSWKKFYRIDTVVNCKGFDN